MIGSFGDVIFEVNNFYANSIEKEVARNRRVKLSQHQPIYGIGSIRHQGRELTEISFTLQLISSLGLSPKLELQKLYNNMELGKFEHLVLGTQVMGEFPFLIQELDEKMSRFNPLFGDFDVIEVEVKMIEYVDNPSFYSKQLEYRKKGVSILLEEDALSIQREQEKKGG